MALSPNRGYYKPMNLVAPSFYLLLLVAPSLHLFAETARGDVLRYRDDSGKTHFVDRADKVPEKYRSQLDGQTQLPPISRSAPGRKELYKKKHYGAAAVSKTVEVFVTSWCPYCRELEAFLTSEGVPFKRYDIESSTAGRKIYEQLGGGGVPVTRIGSTVLRGFDREKMSRVLGLGGGQGRGESPGIRS